MNRLEKGYCYTLGITTVVHLKWLYLTFHFITFIGVMEVESEFYFKSVSILLRSKMLNI